MSRGYRKRRTQKDIELYLREMERSRTPRREYLKSAGPFFPPPLNNKIKEKDE